MSKILNKNDPYPGLAGGSPQVRPTGRALHPVGVQPYSRITPWPTQRRAPPTTDPRYSLSAARGCLLRSAEPPSKEKREKTFQGSVDLRHSAAGHLGLAAAIEAPGHRGQLTLGVEIL
jgi:hypothetical protein